jgi:lipoprotein-anchoring transpeptidase ErfK/SrfK
MIRSLRPRAGVLLAVAGVLLAGGTLVLTSNGSHVPPVAGPSPTPAPTPMAQVASVRSGDVVPWSQPLTITATSGSLTSVAATGPDGLLLQGTLTPTSWSSLATLTPGAAYSVHVVLTNADGVSSSYDRTLHASQATKVLKATVSPDGGTYGVGQPVIVRFNHKVKGAAARRAVLERLQVSTTPAVQGAWRWFNSFEVHYRGPAYWTSGTQVSVTADLRGLRLPGSDIWGSSKVATGGMTIGDAFIATVDVTAHKMTVTRNGKVIRVVNVSTGRDKYPTKGGVHLVLVREKVHLYNSGTVGIPTESPGGYYEKLPWSVRISNGGAFVHANPATVKYQGRVNVSHGCVNTSVEDAHWFYDNTHLGDVVNVIHAAVGPLRTDAGMSDWNYSWATWQQGNLGV